MSLTITLGAGETAVVGYGLLLWRKTVDETLGRTYQGPFAQCHIEGWRRSWDVSMPNEAFHYEKEGHEVYPEKILYLNVRRDPVTLMNCAVFVLPRDDLAVMHAREWIYDAVAVTSDLRGVHIDGGDALMYVGKQEHRVQTVTNTADIALRRSYLRMLDRALDALDPAIGADYRRTTDPFPEHLVIDDATDPEGPGPSAAARRTIPRESRDAG